MRLFTLTFTTGKVHFSCCFIQNWEEIESLKNEKSPGILFSHFCTNPELVERFTGDGRVAGSSLTADVVTILCL